VWIHGPYPAGKFANITFSTKVFAHFLNLYKWVEADKGYRGHADKVKCPANDANPAEKRAIQARMRARREILNGQLRTWGILSHSQVFCHNILLHGVVFRAYVVVTQLTMANGEPLSEVEYKD
jgi:hypothetical protein